MIDVHECFSRAWILSWPELLTLFRQDFEVVDFADYSLSISFGYASYSK